MRPLRFRRPCSPCLLPPVCRLLPSQLCVETHHSCSWRSGLLASRQGWIARPSPTQPSPIQPAPAQPIAHGVRQAALRSLPADYLFTLLETDQRAMSANDGPGIGPNAPLNAPLGKGPSGCSLPDSWVSCASHPSRSTAMGRVCKSRTRWPETVTAATSSRRASASTNGPGPSSIR